MKLFSLLEVRYNQFITSIQKYLSRTLSDYNITYNNSSVFGQLVGVISGVIHNIMLYIEDSLTEQNKYTAQRKKSLYGLASLSGYEPSYGKATGVQLKLNFTPTNTQSLSILLNNKTPLTCTQNGLTYNLILPQEAILLSTEKDPSTKYFYAVQGVFESQTFISSGGKLYTQNFKFLGNLDTDYLQVKINNEVWEKKDSLYDMEPDAKQYTYKVSYINGIDLVFGNDVHGRALQGGDSIEVTYLLHDGEGGNINSSEETYFIFNDPVSNISGEEIDGNSIFNIVFANSDAVITGSDSESIDQVRQMIGFNSRAMVLARSENYKCLINKFSFCGYNRTWSEPGSLIVNSLIIKNYKSLLRTGKDYFNLTEKDLFLSQAQKQSVVDYIESSGSQLAGVVYNIKDPEVCKYALYLYIKLKKGGYDTEYITTQIRNLVGEFFSNINNDNYVPKSDIVQLLKSNIDAIDGVNAYFLSERNETAIINKQYIDRTSVYDPSKGVYINKTETVYLYPGENPGLGLDSHNNIYLQSDNQFPVLMGGWSYQPNSTISLLTDQLVTITDPLIIIFE